MDDAIQRGLDALNVTRDKVSVQVLDQGVRGIGGIRPREARVRLTVNKPAVSALAAAGLTLGGDEEAIARDAVQTLQELLNKMRVKAQIKSRWEVYEARPEKPRARLVLDVRGDDLGVLIGRRSETVDALQYLTRLILAREVHQLEGRFDLIVDIEGYKARRENQLKQLAGRMAERVAATRKPVALEPMPAYERRIIHIALRDHPTVTTESVGRGDRRKVTIIPRKK